MRDSRPPWFKFFATDWIADPNVTLMSSRQKGWYVTLLAYAWQEQGICNADAKLKQLAGFWEDHRECPDADGLDKLEEEWREVIGKFSHSLPDGRITHPKIYAQSIEVNEASDRRRGAAAKRWGKHSFSDADSLQEQSDVDVDAMQMQCISKASVRASVSVSESVSQVSLEPDSTVKTRRTKSSKSFSSTEIQKLTNVLESYMRRPAAGPNGSWARRPLTAEFVVRCLEASNGAAVDDVVAYVRSIYKQSPPDRDNGPKDWGWFLATIEHRFSQSAAEAAKDTSAPVVECPDLERKQAAMQSEEPGGYPTTPQTNQRVISTESGQRKRQTWEAGLRRADTDSALAGLLGEPAESFFSETNDTTAGTG